MILNSSYYLRSQFNYKKEHLTILSKLVLFEQKRVHLGNQNLLSVPIHILKRASLRL